MVLYPLLTLLNSLCPESLGSLIVNIFTHTEKCLDYNQIKTMHAHCILANTVFYVVL